VSTTSAPLADADLILGEGNDAIFSSLVCFLLILSYMLLHLALAGYGTFVC